jgi:3-deoxy-D-manno-octulosonic-acid transferase
MLNCFSYFFLQNDRSKILLENINIKNVTVSGDTRFDRVIAIAENFYDVQLIKEFCNNSKVVVAGSTWEDDEAVLAHYTKTHPEIKFIIAPHEIDKENLADVKKTFPGSIFYSELTTGNKQQAIQQPSTVNCLIIDNVGMLSRLYKYANVTYVGGGFGDDGLHNILEAAVYGKPVIFGPEIERNFEAQELTECEGAIIINNALELGKTLNELFKNEEELKTRSEAAKKYVFDKAGATEKILDHIQEKRLLTN